MVGYPGGIPAYTPRVSLLLFMPALLCASPPCSSRCRRACSARHSLLLRCRRACSARHSSLLHGVGEPALRVLSLLSRQERRSNSAQSLLLSPRKEQQLCAKSPSVSLPILPKNGEKPLRKVSSILHGRRAATLRRVSLIQWRIGRESDESHHPFHCWILKKVTLFRSFLHFLTVLTKVASLLSRGTS